MMQTGVSAEEPKIGAGAVAVSRMFTLLLTVAAFICASCEKDDTGIVNSRRGVIIPLKTGNEWIGTQGTRDTADTEVSSSLLSIRISSDTVIAGEQWF